MYWVSFAALVCALAVSATLIIRLRTQLLTIKRRFATVIDIESEAAAAKQDLDNLQSEIDNLRSDYTGKRKTYDELRAEIAIYDERLSFAELGIYEPHFEYDDSETFKQAIKFVREEQKHMVQAKIAVEAGTNWSVDGSRSKGKTMSNRAVRLTLRALNGECDVAIANVRWNNVTAMEKRIQKGVEQINKLNASNDVSINQEYYQLKLEELRLTHEYREKQKEERDERAELARLAREEKRLVRDVEDARKAEAKYQNLLKQARLEARPVEADMLEQYQKRITALEEHLRVAHEKSERAIAMAEITRSGYVYIISNVGSFGKNTIKIGMTRRLDPNDRVRELGDASVPFKFDTHAIIYSDDAPALESALHTKFDAHRINKANNRKEFFKVSISAVKTAVEELAPNASFFSDIEAQELRETIALRKKAMNQRTVSQDQFPTSL